MSDQLNQSSAPPVPANQPAATQDAAQAAQGQGADINALLAQLKAQIEPKQAQQPLKQVQAEPQANELPKSLGGYSVKDADPTTFMALQAAHALAKGIDFDRVVGNALSRGDPSLIDTKYLSEAYPEQAKELKRIATTLVEYVTQRSEQLQQQVYSMVGGEENWDAAVNAFNQSAPLSVRRSVARDLDSKDPTRIMEAAQTVQAFAQMGGFMSQRTPSPINPNVPAGGSQQGLSYKEFKEALAKLDANGGRRDSEWVDNITLLMKARAIGKAANR